MWDFTPESRSRDAVREAGLEVADVPEVAAQADVLMLAIPDHIQGEILPGADWAEPAARFGIDVCPRV